ncbi:heterokaryon incompatibility protein-domain-containing protein [Leptodontidium sp. MPI-SDFR-AT-0119]|nr:heterokaryon incompatibility protein-domain-containing protein [Leptodontidium sp. MPI-SDFR-AT-0119]
MRLLHRDDEGNLVLTEFFGDTVPPYAALSHTWGAPGEEVILSDIANAQTRHKRGWGKINFCEKQAASHGLKHFWVDTCCIDKSSSAELTEAINSMFRWYREAARCYVFLANVSTANQDTAKPLPDESWKPAFRKSRWFTRGWTLQELVAPASVEFFSVEGRLLGDKKSLEIEKMAWVSNRNTTRKEDQAYCLLGIFDISMTWIYGEGDKAFRRLEKKIEESANVMQTSSSKRLKTTHDELPGFDFGQTREDILSSIFYPEHALRREDVKPPWENTFQWIFHEEHDDDDGNVYPKNRTGFPDWLRGSSSTYWISGKAGSGKSTLMSYILHDYRLNSNLKIWSQGHDVHILSFFFWRAGSELQKSVTGMLRSLLYQLVEEVPNAADTLVSNLQLMRGRIPVWTERSLAMSFKAALAAAAGKHFCLLLDGLDEFEGDTDELLDLVFKLQALDNVKCCVSSRPDVQLVARLSTYKQLRLQDLNFGDISRFVEEKLDGYSESHDFSGSGSWLAHSIAFKAEGVFLWAALVTASAVRGLQAGDDDKMVRKRVESTPSAMEALFMQMLASVEDVHRESLAFYIQAMRGNRQNSARVSVALMTAAIVPEELTNYQEFASKCARTEKQIIARSKGLLDVLDTARWRRRLSAENLVWSIPQDAESANLRLSSQRTRKEIAQSRSPTRWSSSHQIFMGFDKKIVSFVHRSAYDFLLSPECENAIGVLSTASPASIQNDIVQAQIKMLVAAPNPINNYSRDEFRDHLAAVMHSILDYTELSSKSHDFLDELQGLLPHFPLEEHAGITEKKFLSHPIKLFRQSLTWLYFWDSCIRQNQVDYVLARLSRISELNCCGILYSTLISRCINMLLSGAYLERNFSKLLLLITSMLKNLKQLYNEHSLVPSKQSLNFAEGEVAGSLGNCDISWLRDEIPPPFHDDEIVLQMTRAFISWYIIPQRLSSDRISPERSKPFVVEHVEKITSLFKAITDPWDIHAGNRSRQKFLRSERILFFEISVDAFVQYANAARQRGEGQSVRPVFESPPKLRVVYVSPPETVKGKHTIKPFKDSVVVTYDLGPRVRSRLLNFLGITTFGHRHLYKHKETFVGNSEEYEACQKLMIDDVWENAGGKLSAWQQLYFLACLKTKLRDEWKFLDDEE